MIDSLLHLPESTIMLDDPETGLSGVIVLHSTALGPALGGCSLQQYPDLRSCTHDALRLAEGASYRHALAGLPFGGGAAVLNRPEMPFSRKALFESFARSVKMLGGRYIAAADCGTNAADMALVAAITRHVAAPSPAEGRAHDVSHWKAYGALQTMTVALRHRYGRAIAGAKVAVQGLDETGFALCALLHRAGAQLIISDDRPDRVLRAEALFNASACSSESLHKVEADIFVPCMLRAPLDAAMVEALAATIVCGAADNQLPTELGAGLAERGILYVPDYLANAGGAIAMAAAYLGWDAPVVSARVDAVATRLATILQRADALGLTPEEAAAQAARECVGDARATQRRAA